MLQCYFFYLRPFGLINWSFFVNSNMRCSPYVHPRHDSILEFCQTFPIGFIGNLKHLNEQFLRTLKHLNETFLVHLGASE